MIHQNTILHGSEVWRSLALFWLAFTGEDLGTNFLF